MPNYCTVPSHERFRGVSNAIGTCLACELEKTSRLLKLHQELLRRTHLCCEDLHHEKSEYHTGLDCPVIKKFEEIVP